MGSGVGAPELFEPLEAVEQLDAQMLVMTQEEAGLRLRLGQLLERMQRGACCLELGFSSLAAYALERCERSGRWVEVACCLARRLEALPLLRRAVATGRISWSMGELLARVSQPQDEAHWLELAGEKTLREMRRVVSEARRALDTGVAAAATLADGPELTCTLTCTLDREEAWLLEATRALLEQFGTRGAEDQLEALLAEAQAALLVALPADEVELTGIETAGEAQRRWREQLASWRYEAEARCEERMGAGRCGHATLSEQLTVSEHPRVSEHPTLNSERTANSDGVSIDGVSSAGVTQLAAQGSSSLAGLKSAELDGAVRRLAGALARRELELSRLLRRFHRADGWRRLGYATEGHYARARLGLSRSSVVARRSLALRLEALPGVAAALSRAEIGIEAALQLVRIATPRTELGWLDRARQRTVKHLREEVAAALTAVRLSGDVHCPPPEAAELAGFQELERAVLSGHILGGTPNRPQPGCTLEPTEQPLADSREPSSGRPSSEDPSSQPPAPGKPLSSQPLSSQSLSSQSLSSQSASGKPSSQPWREMLGSLRAWLASGGIGRAIRMSAPRSTVLDDAVQMSAPIAGSASRQTRSAGRVEWRWRVSPELRGWWQALQAKARPRLRAGVSWVKFLCLTFWSAWRHMLGVNVSWGQVYLRDCCRCSSPVCSRRDVTPHHLRFRSAGGGDEDENMISLCSCCHLFGVHAGRIRATGTARRIFWELGSREEPCVRVDGRQRV